MFVERQTTYNAWRIIEGIFGSKKVLLVRTGVGKDNALSASKYILSQYPISLIISIGFGGALVAGFEVGDLFLCQKLCCIDESNGGFKSDSDLITQAEKVMKCSLDKVLTGDSLTVDKLVTRPDEKLKLGVKFRAQVVDMESYWVADTAAKRNIPFLAVRVISDTLDESLPPFDNFIGSRGELMWLETLSYFWSRPRELFGILKLYFHAQLAGRRLTSFLGLLVPEIVGKDFDASDD